MLNRIQIPGTGSWLSTRGPSAPSFTAHGRMSRALVPVWDALREGDPDAAYRNAMDGLDACRSGATSQKAGLLAGLAGAELASGRLDHAMRHALQSIQVVPAQWISRRIVACIQFRRRDYAAAYQTIVELPMDLHGPSWDEEIDAREIETILAACAWNLSQWPAVIEHLGRAWPEGDASMPEYVIEELFRVRMYVGRPDLAARAADLLVRNWTPERADELLQTLVQRRHTAEALPLYRDVFDRNPGSELIRRRLVALCIKEGAVEEARRLVAPAALRTAA